MALVCMHNYDTLVMDLFEGAFRGQNCATDKEDRAYYW